MSYSLSFSLKFRGISYRITQLCNLPSLSELSPIAKMLLSARDSFCPCILSIMAAKFDSSSESLPVSKALESG